jgi:hypothetical protein
MQLTKRTLGVAAISAGLVLAPGCSTNTGAGALVGGGMGAVAGGLLGGRHAAAGAIVGGLAGALAGAAIGHAIDREQERQLQESSQGQYTLWKVQYNDAVYAGYPPPPPPPMVVAAPAPYPAPYATPAPYAPPAPAPAAGPTAAAAAAPAPAPVAAAPSPAPAAPGGPGLQPLALADIEALSAAGVKPEAITAELDRSGSTFTAQDIAAARQSSNPPVDPKVIQCMQSNPC